MPTSAGMNGIWGIIPPGGIGPAGNATQAGSADGAGGGRPASLNGGGGASLASTQPLRMRGGKTFAGDGDGRAIRLCGGCDRVGDAAGGGGG